jgi:hypothetical protein
MKLVPIALLFTLASGCGPAEAQYFPLKKKPTPSPTIEPEPTPTQLPSYIEKVVDGSVVCYLYYSNSISCIKVGE